MDIILLAFATLMIAAGLVILFEPKTIIIPISRYSGSRILFTSAILVRLIVGVVLLLYADQSKFPITFSVLAWLFIAGALAIALIGRNRLQKVILWTVELMQAYARVGGVLAICLGGFIFYAIG